MNDEEIFDEIEIISMEGENGDTIDFLIVDVIEFEKTNYLLVIEARFAEDDETEATILKETFDEAGFCIYKVLEEGEEFSSISSLFIDNENYEIEL